MSAAKKRLGRGLGNLISGGAPETAAKKAAPKQAEAKTANAASAKKVAIRPHRREEPAIAPDPQISGEGQPLPGADYKEIPVAKLVPSPYQPRREIDPDQIRQLAESIRSEGLLQPIVVRKVDEGFELIAGERRWRAHQLLGIKTIMARVMDASDTSAAVIALIENLQREGLNPIEESLGYASLMSDFDLTQESVAERVGRSRAAIANSLRLLQLDREVQGYLSKGMLSVGHAKVLLGVEDVAHRSVLARRVIENSLSVRELERLVRKLREEGGSSAKRSTRVNAQEQTVIQDLERQLSSQLNTKVVLKHTPKKGRIIIDYHGNEDLQRILEKTGLQ